MLPTRGWSRQLNDIFSRHFLFYYAATCSKSTQVCNSLLHVFFFFFVTFIYLEEQNRETPLFWDYGTVSSEAHRFGPAMSKCIFSQQCEETCFKLQKEKLGNGRDKCQTKIDCVDQLWNCSMLALLNLSKAFLASFKSRDGCGINTTFPKFTQKCWLGLKTWFWAWQQRSNLSGHLYCKAHILLTSIFLGMLLCYKQLWEQFT